MEYLIAGIRIDIPHRFTTGAFGMALAPFAAENKTETDAGSNRMAGPVPGTATTAAPSRRKPRGRKGVHPTLRHPRRTRHNQTSSCTRDCSPATRPAIANSTHSTSPTPMPTAVSAATRRATCLP